MPLRLPQLPLPELNIPQVKPIGPLEAASAALGLQEKRQGVQINALKIKEAQQEQQDEQSIRQAAQQAGNDPDGIYQLLITQNPRAAEKWGKMVADRRKVETENTKAKLDNDFRRADMTERLLRSAVDDESLQRAKIGIDSLLGPGSSRELGDTYDPARVDAVRNRAISHADWLKAQQDAVKNAQDAQKAELDKGKESREARESWEKSVASAMAATQDENDFQSVVQTYAHLGAPKELLAQYGQNWTPQTAEKAATVLGRQPKQKSFEELTYEDYLKSPLSGKYGPNRIGFDQYKQVQRIAATQAGRVDNEPLVPVVGPDGKAVYMPRSQAAGQAVPSSSQNRPPSEGERTAFRFYERMQGAMTDLANVEDEIKTKGLGGQAVLKLAPNFLQSETNQIYQQAQRAFTEARLRKDSGAAIPESEYENDRRTYFVQPGDTKAVLEQKARSRATALEAIRKSAGRAYEETYGELPGKSGGKKLDEATAKDFLNKAGGDKNKARQLAKDAGYTWD